LQVEITKPGVGNKEEKDQLTSTGTAVPGGTAEGIVPTGAAPMGEQYAMQILLEKSVQERR
jgi:hypothetical protein